MKKIIIGALVVGSMLFASTQIAEVELSKSEKMKIFLEKFEALDLVSVKILKDYYETKVCSKDFYNAFSVEDTRNFVSGSPIYYTLMQLHITDESAYNQLISDYKFMNCGIGKISGK